MEFNNILNGVTPIFPGLINELSNILKIETLKKNEYLLEAGDFCENIYFVKKGLLRFFYSDEKVKEDCSLFMKENDAVLSFISFLKNEPSTEWIQALEACTLLYITHTEWEDMSRHSTTVAAYRCMICENYILAGEHRKDILSTSDLLVRYNLLLERHPDYIGRVPDKYLASYLNMSVSTLNELKNMAK